MKVLTIHSFAVHGTASLKAILSILGTRVLPVPSLYLTGLTNIPGHEATQVEFERLLKGSLKLAKDRGEDILLYIGYLGSQGQVNIILEAIQPYRDIIKHILVDPVSGDHGRAYVPESVIEAWPKLLEIADWAFPNFTEVGLYAQSDHDKVEDILGDFHRRFPQLSFIATSVPDDENRLRLHLHAQKDVRDFCHEKLMPHFGGTGDVFVSWFIRFYFFDQMPVGESLKQAADKTVESIRRAIELGSADLVLETLSGH